MNLSMVADLVSQHLADASQTPFGLDPKSCAELAVLLDEANAQQAPLAKIVPIKMGRRATLSAAEGEAP